MSAAETVMPQFLQLVDNSIGGSIVDPNYKYTRYDLISLFCSNFEEKGLFSEVLDLCFFHGFMDASDKSNPVFEKYYLTLKGREYLENPDGFRPEESQSAQELYRKIDSTDWTGLAKQISAAQKVVISAKANELLALIIQSDADETTRIDACKRVEAVVALLQAANSPWKEIVSLLSHPVLNAFFAATSLTQFIVGIAK